MTLHSIPASDGPRPAMILAAFCLIGLLLPAAATAEPRAEADVAIAIRSLDAQTKPAISDIVVLAIGLRLERQGLSSAVLGQLDPAAAAKPAEALAREGSLNADSLLLAETSERGNTLSLHLAWFDRATGALIAELGRSGAEDMRLDAMIFQAVGDLLGLVGARTPIQAKPRRVEPAPAAELPVAAAAVAAPAVSAALSAPSLAETPNPPALPSRSDPSTARSGLRQGPKGLELGLGGGPFLATGELGNFFKTSGGLTGRIMWNFAGPTSSLGLGLSLGALAFKAEGPLESATGVLIPLSLDLRLSAAAGEGQLWPFIRAGFGAALIRLQTAIYHSRSTMLPYAGLSLGLGRSLASGLALSLELPFQAFLDGKDLIMGFSPAVGLCLFLGRRP